MATPTPLPWHELARAYAQMGWRIVPMHVFLSDQRRCTCGQGYCSTPHPRLELEEATVDLETIRDWGDQWDEAAVGLVPGGPAHVVALEVSLRQGAKDTLSAIDPSTGWDRDTPMFVYAGKRKVYLYRYTASEVTTEICLGKGVRLYGGTSKCFTLPAGLTSKHRRWTRHWLYAPATHDVSPLPSWVTAEADLPSEESESDAKAELSSPRRVDTAPADTAPAGGRPLLPSRYDLNPQGGDGSADQDEPALAAGDRSAEKAISDTANKEHDLSEHGPQADIERADIDCELVKEGGDEHASCNAALFDGPEAHELPSFQQFSEEQVSRRAQTQWYAWPWLAESSLTVFTGRAKQSGKTTFLLHMLAGILNNRLFLGQRCTIGRVAYVSDQSPDTLSQLLLEAGLSNQRALDRFHVLYSDLVVHEPWDRVVYDSAEYAGQKNLDLLIFDSVQPFLDGRPLPEQLSDPNFVAPLCRAVGRGLAVAVTCSIPHEADELKLALDQLGGLANAADTVAHLATPTAGVRRNRCIEIASRYPAVPERVVIEHTGTTIESRGTMFAHRQGARSSGRRSTERDREERTEQSRPAIKKMSG